MSKTSRGESNDDTPRSISASQLSRPVEQSVCALAGVVRIVGQYGLKDNVQGRANFVADNNGFDWQFVNWYFHHFLGRNPFGFSSVNLGSLCKGLVRNTSASFKHLRKTRHTHHPVDDAMGNAEALLHMKEALGLKIKL